jgi:hypothetical protein
MGSHVYAQQYLQHVFEHRARLRFKDVVSREFSPIWVLLTSGKADVGQVDHLF